MQVGDDDRHPVEVVRLAKHVVPQAALLVGALHADLQGRVPRLDEMSGEVGVLGQAVRDGHDHRVAARAQALRHRRGVQQDPVAHDRLADDIDVGQSTRTSPSSVTTTSSTAPGQDPRIRSTTPARHRSPGER